MTPPAASTARTVRQPASGPATVTRPRPATTPRRVSGPGRKPARTRTQPAPTGAREQLRARAGQVLDRLLRGRAWVMLVGGLLAGIVFLNVTVLELNRGIAQSAQRAATLEQQNSVLRSRLAGVESAESIQRAAEALGYVLPQPGDITYLHPNPSRDARAAAQRIAPSSPSSALAGQTGTGTPSGSASSSTATGPSGVAGTGTGTVAATGTPSQSIAAAAAPPGPAPLGTTSGH